MSLTRRRALGLGVGTLGAGALSTTQLGCAPPGTNSVNQQPPIPPADGPVRLTYWAWLKDLQKVCDVWNAQNPRIQVEAVWIPGGNSGGYQKLFSALSAGSGPDIGQVEMRTVPEFLLGNGLVDLTRYGVERFQRSYTPAIWNQVSFAGGVYGIPQDTGPVAFYHRPDLIGEVGEVPTTWDAWLDLARAVKQRWPDRALESFNVSDASQFTALATQAGAVWFRAEADGWVVSMTDEPTLRVARLYDTALSEGLLDSGYGAFSPGWNAAAGADKILAVTSASWADALLTTLTSGEGKWRVAPMPRWSEGYGSTYLGGSTAAVLANSRHPAEALEFLIWMTTSREGIDAMIANSGIGWSPSPDYIGASRTEGDPWFGGQAYNTEVFEPASSEQNPDWTWGPITQRTFNFLTDGMRRKLTEGRSLVDTLAEAQRQTIETMRRTGLTVREGSA